jgi:hypothetical protein
MPKKEYHSGIVRDVDDPLKRGRLIVECPDVAYGQTLPWADPKMCFVDSEMQAGSFWIPNVGAVVEVEIESEEDSEANSLEPKWKCDVYPEGTVPEIFQTNYPQRRGWVTAAGHILYFDDTEGQLEFKYIHPTGTELVVTNDGQMQLTPVSGQSVLIGGEADEQIPRGNILDTFLDALKVWADAHTQPVTGTAAAGTPPADHVHAVTGTAAAPSSASTAVPSNLLSDYHKVK